MNSIFERCVVCGDRPDPARRLGILLPEGRLGVVCGHHDPTAPGFREDLFFGLFRWHGLAIDDVQSVVVAETVAQLVVAALAAAEPPMPPRSRPDRLTRAAHPKAAGVALPPAGQPGSRRHGRPRRASCAQS